MNKKTHHFKYSILLILTGTLALLSSCSKDSNDAEYVAVESITLNMKSIKAKKIGEQFQIVATILPENATNKGVKYQSLNNEVVTVDINGMATTVGEGITMIKAETEDGKKLAFVGVKVNLTRKQQSSFISMYYDETKEFVSSFIPSDCSLSVSNVNMEPFSSSELITNGNDITVKAKRPSMLTFTITAKNNESYFTEFVNIKILARPLTEEEARQMLLGRAVSDEYGINSNGEWWVKGNGASIAGPTWKLVDEDGDGDFSSAKIVGTEGTCNYSISFGETIRTGTIYNCEESFNYYNLTPLSVDYKRLWF